MNTIINFTLLYPYPYQIKAQLFAFVILAFIVFIAFIIYSFITSDMNAKAKRIFDRSLIITGVLMVVLFFTEMTVSLITINQVDRQLGFSSATPDTPEGELFEIQKVVPGKTMDIAGLKRFDQVQMNNVNDLYRLIINNQGKVVIIPVRRDKKEIAVRVEVPELAIPLKGISFLF